VNTKTKGVITVYLSLSLFIVISLLVAIIASARDRAMRQRVEMAMDMSLQSVFAEYNRVLLDKYDLYFIDCSYGSDSGNILKTREHFNDYFEYNINPSKSIFVLGSKDLFGLKLDNSNITLYSLATDDNSRVYKRQAIHYVKDKFGISIINQLNQNKKTYQNKNIDNYNTKQKRDAAYEKIKRADQKKDENGNEIEYENPVKSIEDERSGILSLILENNEISNKRIQGNDIPSKRNLKCGDGMVCNDENLDSSINELLFSYYLSDKFSSYIDKKNNAGLEYELEYILFGQSQDKDNLKKIVTKLLIIREAANSIAIFIDENKISEAKVVASALALLLLSPELEEPLTEIILFAWAFAEACVDVRTLLDGGKVPLIKSSKDWVLGSLAKALGFKQYLKSGKIKGKNGLSYSDYLLMFISTMDKDKKIKRSMDMIETNLRQTVGNYHFCIDQCIEFLEIEADITSLFKYEYSIRRYFGYEKIPNL